MKQLASRLNGIFGTTMTAAPAPAAKPLLPPTLVYTATQEPVKVGDVVQINGMSAVVDYFPHPHKPASSGKVSVSFRGDSRSTAEYFVSVIGAHWINRDDLMDTAKAAAAAPVMLWSAVSKITARMLAMETSVRTKSSSGLPFIVTSAWEHAGHAPYACRNLTQGTTYPCMSLAEVREWMRLN